MKVCMCVTGPPPGGVCGACGAVGPGYIPPTNVPPQYTPGRIDFYPVPLTADDVRRIVREEIERARNVTGESL